MENIENKSPEAALEEIKEIFDKTNKDFFL